MPQLSVGETLSDALNAVTRNYGTYLRTYGVFLLAVGVLGALAGLVLALSPVDFQSLDPQAVQEDPSLATTISALGLVSVFVAIASLVLHALGAGVGVVVTDALLRGEHPGLGDAWARLKPRAGTLVLTIVLVGIVTLLLAGLAAGMSVQGAATGDPVVGLVGLAPLAFAVFLATIWFLVPAVGVFEGGSVTETMARSRTLTRGARGTVLLLLLALVALYLTASFLLSAVGTFVTTGLDPTATPTPGDVVVMQALGLVADLVILPLMVAAVTIAYWRLASAAAGDAAEAVEPGDGGAGSPPP